MIQQDFLTSIGSYIGKNGLGTIGQDLYLGFVPGTPYVCTAVLLNGGPRMRGNPTRFRSVQIITRHTDPVTAMTKADSLHALFDDKWGSLDVARTFRGRFHPDHEQGVHVIDENGHYVYSLNFTFTTIESGTG